MWSPLPALARVPPQEPSCARPSALGLEQLLLHGQPPAVPAQAPVAADHAVARHDQGDPIRRARARHGPDSSRRADVGSYLGVRARLSGRDAPQRRPDARLERCAGDIDGNVKMREVPVSDGPQRRRGVGELVVGTDELRGGQLGTDLFEERRGVRPDPDSGEAEIPGHGSTVPTCVSTDVQRRR